MCAAIPASSAARAALSMSRTNLVVAPGDDDTSPDGTEPVRPRATDLVERGATVSIMPRVSLGGAGDHPEVQQFLSTVFQAGARDAFYSSLDDPFYEPRDRLLVKTGSRIVSHVHLTRRVMRFAGELVLAAGLSGLGTLPEYRGRGYAGQLLAAADHWMLRERSLLGLLRTKIPHFFRPAGWAVCGRHSQARAGSRELLAQLSALRFPGREPPLTIRPWRQMELPALEQVYRLNIVQATGALERTEAYWRWLISRKGYDQVFVAVEGADPFERDEVDVNLAHASRRERLAAVESLADAPHREAAGRFSAPIVGYCVVKEDRIVELMALPGHPTAAQELLARACSDAIEHDHHHLVLDANANDPLMELFRRAGGDVFHNEALQGEVLMVKVLDAHALLKAIAGRLHQRMAASGLPRPCELGLLVESQKYRLDISRRSVRVARQKIGRSYLACNLAEFTRLVLGHDDVDEAISRGRLEASTRVAVDVARILFPRLPLWRPPLDDLLG